MGKKLHIANLSQDTTEKDLRNLFKQVGKLVTVSVAVDGETGASRGFGSVEMRDEEGALSAIETLNGAVLNGSKIQVNAVRLPTNNQKPSSSRTGARAAGKRSSVGRSPARKRAARSAK